MYVYINLFVFFFFNCRSLKPMIMSVFDPSGAEILRQNRSILSGTITDMINEYGPKAFPDFDGNTKIICFL